MIVPMEKVTALIFHKKKESFLHSLQKVGVVHISLDKKLSSDEDIKNREQCIQRCENFLKSAVKIKNKKEIKSTVSADEKEKKEAFSYVEAYEKAKENFHQLAEQIEKLERQLRNIAPWGNFDFNLIKKLSDSGINIRFFIVPIKKFSACVNEQIYYQEISRDKTYIYFVVFEKNDPVTLDCDEFFYPETDKGKLQAEYNTLLEEKKKIESLQIEILSNIDQVKEYLHIQQTEYAFLLISNGLNSEVENKLYIVHGWLPRSMHREVEEFLDKNDIYSYFSKPQQDERPPILLKNNRFSKLFEPITRLFDLPKYSELDLTVFFAPFFALFFGFCLGDAGYGLIILLISIGLRNKVSAEKKSILSLLSFLGLATFLVGMISGTLFGIDVMKSNLEPLKKIVLFDQNGLFNAALILGCIQIFFGLFLKTINRIRQYGFLAGLSTLGWIIMLSGLIGLVAFKQSIWAVYFGIALILLFNDLKANIFLRIGKGIWELYGITGVFGDLLSYIRLFALSIASSILGFVINDIAFQAKEIPFIGFLVTFLILVVGHTGNLLLSSLSAFVHPLRLTFVEFYKSAGFEGGGKAYNPFKKFG
ncbi:MAG: ATPase [Candidatus Omnitrophota bacterium]|nr:MAG: ATPase [Candidatus Omnitrophota bacterium]